MLRRRRRSDQVHSRHPLPERHESPRVRCRRPLARYSDSALSARRRAESLRPSTKRVLPCAHSHSLVTPLSAAHTAPATRSSLAVVGTCGGTGRRLPGSPGARPRGPPLTLPRVASRPTRTVLHSPYVVDSRRTGAGGIAARRHHDALHDDSRTLCTTTPGSSARRRHGALRLTRKVRRRPVAPQVRRGLARGRESLVSAMSPA